MRPQDPHPRSRTLRLTTSAAESVQVRDDFHSDRLRCDHPWVGDGAALGDCLVQTTLKLRRSRAMVLAHELLAGPLLEAGFLREAVMPAYYPDGAACHVLGWSAEAWRAEEAAVSAEVDRILDQASHLGRSDLPPTRRASPADAVAIADLIAETFETYPTPSGYPGYVERQLRDGIPFRLHHGQDGRLLGCSSADLDRPNAAAELTDCAVHPAARRQGVLQALLRDLIGDLRGMEYRTAFTFARAGIPGVNRAFQLLGFARCGRSPRSCRIGGGFEDMNTWSLSLA